MPLNKETKPNQTRNNFKNLEELKNNDIIKEIQDTTTIIKSQRQPKNISKILTSFTFGENTTEGITKCTNKKNVEYVI